MTKTVRENPQGKPGHASTADEVLKKMEVAHQTFMNEFGWLNGFMNQCKMHIIIILMSSMTWTKYLNG